MYRSAAQVLLGHPGRTLASLAWLLLALAALATPVVLRRSAPPDAIAPAQAVATPEHAAGAGAAARPDTSPQVVGPTLYEVREGDVGVGAIARDECGDWALWPQIMAADGSPLARAGSGDPIIERGQLLLLPAACGSPVAGRLPEAAPDRSASDGDAARAMRDADTGGPSAPPASAAAGDPQAQGGASAAMGRLGARIAASSAAPWAACTVALAFAVLGLRSLPWRELRRSWQWDKQVAAARARRRDDSAGEAARLLNGLERALTLLQLDWSVELIREISGGHELLVRRGPNTGQERDSDAYEVGSRLGAPVEWEGRGGAYLLLRVDALPEPADPDHREAAGSGLLHVGNDVHGGAVWLNLAAVRLVGLIGDTAGLGVLRCWLAQLGDVAVPGYRVGADHASAALAGAEGRGSGGIAEIAASLHRHDWRDDDNSYLVLTPQTPDELDQLASLRMPGGPRLIVTGSAPLLDDCITITVRRTGRNIAGTLVVPGADYELQLPDIAVRPKAPPPDFVLLPGAGFAPPAASSGEDGDAYGSPGGQGGREDRGADAAGGAAAAGSEYDEPGVDHGDDELFGNRPSGARAADAAGGAAAAGSDYGEAGPDYGDDELFGNRPSGARAADAAGGAAAAGSEYGETGADYDEDLPFGAPEFDAPPLDPAAAVRAGRQSDGGDTDSGGTSAIEGLVFHINLLGEFLLEARFPDGVPTPIVLGRQPVRVLLCWVVANKALGLPVEREALAALLRPGKATANRAMSADVRLLRRELRRAVHMPPTWDLLPLTETGISLDEKLFGSDIADFVRLAAAAGAAAEGEDGAAALADWQRAFDLIRGEPLHDETGEAAAGKRAELQQVIGEAAGRAAALAHDQGRSADAAAFTAAARLAGVAVPEAPA